LNKIIFFDIDDVLFNTATFIDSGLKTYKAYEDSASTLTKLKNLSQVAILSKGEYNLQLTKLRSTNLLDFFEKENIFIVDAKDSIVKNIFSKFKDFLIFVIEDKLDNLSEIKKNEPRVKTVFLKRGRYKDAISSFIPDFKIEKLEDLINIL
jgi:FMN phosphatase YigB (HAD superfamily)